MSGYRLEFSEEIPNQTQSHVPHPYKFITEEKLAIDEDTHTLLEQNVIEKCNHQPGEYISNIFTREKKDGEYSLDLKDAYYSIPIHPSDRKFIAFPVEWRIISVQSTTKWAFTRPANH